jgi:ABC-type lipoprotein release transport system permease subunit
MLLLYSRMGLRNIRRNVRRSLLTIAAIAFGLFSLIVFQALKVGLHREMVSSTLGLDAGAIQVHAAGFEANMALLRPLADVARVREAIRGCGLPDCAERLKSPALLLAGRQSSSIMLTGVVPEEEKAVTFISRRIIAGSYLAEADRLLLGRPLADSLGVGVGDEVIVMAQGMPGRPATRKFTIGGLYQTDLPSFDRSHAYLPLPAARQFLGAEEAVTEIVLAADPEQAPALAAGLQARLDAGVYQVRPWQQTNPDLQQLIELNDATMRLLIVIVFAIVAMGITNTMTTVIFERFREFGIMHAIGAGRGGIVSLVILESFFLGVLAIILGGLAGMAACLYLQRYGIDLSRFISSNQYFAAGHVLRAFMTPADLLNAVLITLATATGAGMYPAWKAARLSPVKAMLHN